MKRLLLFASCMIFLWPQGFAQAQKSGVEPNVLVLPQGPGSLGGVGENVKPNLNMGLMSYQIKVVVPRGRGSATPDPSITYSSSAGSGMVGIGWNFSAGSHVERGTVRGLPTYTNKDIFFAGGELVKIPNGPFYRARMEGSFKRTRWVQKNATDQQGYWIVEGPDGSKSYYGANEKGVLDLDAHVYGTQGTFRWHLTTYVDRNGNKVRYTYFKEGTQVYPDQIAWVFDDNDKPLYHLKFGYEDRPDHISDGKPGFDLVTTKRLKEVQITSNGQRFRSYHMDFEESTGLSRLVKVTRYGRDAQKAFPISFTMKYSDATFSPENSKMVTMPTSLGVDFRTNNLDFVDINGDGLPDVVDTSKAKHVFFMNELKLDKDMKQASHDFPQTLQVQNPTETSAQLSNSSVQMLDYNGDGFTDLVDAVNKKVYINKGDGKWTDSSTSLQNFPVTGKDPNMRFMDYDGDKKIDVVSSDGNTTTFWLNDGKGNWTVQSGKVNIGLGFSKDKLRLIDINGDGLQDVVHITKSSLRYRKYLGVGNWTEWINVKVPDLDKYELDTKAQFADVNGDGMSDMVAFLGNSIVYFVNKNGTEFTAGAQLQTFKGIDIPDSTKTTVRIVDINGNGSRDIVWIDSSGKVVYLELFGKRPNLMTTISNGIGQRINVDYGSSVYFYLRDKECKVGTDKACAGPWQNKMPMAFTVVTKISTWASRSDKPLEQATPKTEERPQVQSIYYHHGFYDGNEKKFRGFRQVETLFDGDESIEGRKDHLFFDVGDTDTYMHGKLQRRIFTDGKGKVFHETRQSWGDCKVGLGGTDAMSLDPPIRFICRKGMEKDIIEGKESDKRTTAMTKEYDEFGNAIVDANLGEKGKDGDEKIVKKTMIVPKDPNDVNALWFLRFPQRIENCAKKEGPCSQTNYFYDGEAFKGLAAGELRKGNVTRIQILRTGTDGFVEPVTNRYDRWGNLAGSKNGSGGLRVYEWDSVYHRFPTRETVELKTGKLTAETKWDYALSQVTQSTDFNGQVTTYTYDAFGRLTTMRQPGDAQDKPSLRYTYELQAPLSRIITETRSTTGGDADRKNIQCFDGLGRKLSVINQLSSGKFLVFNHAEYNRLGKKARAWNNYESDEKCKFTAPSGTGEISYQYDGLGRLRKTTYNDGSVASLVYEPFKRILSDEEDNKQGSPYFGTPTVQLLDGLGRVIEEQKMPAKGKTISTKYAYNVVNADGKDRIAEVTFADGSKKTHEYDLQGNVLKVIDPDRSETTYTYIPNGKVESMTDARGIKLVYTYDGLLRVTSYQQEGKDETKVTYTYDKATAAFKEATFLKGQLASVAYPGGAYSFSYDKRGNNATTRHQLLGVNFDTQQTYNNLDDLLTLTYPNGEKLDFQYDGAGRVLSISGRVKALTYHTHGKQASWEAANGVKTTFTYDKRVRINKIDVGGGKVTALDYTFDAVGNYNAWKETHGDDSFTHTYTYDAMYRLTKADLLGGKEVVDVQQDDLHNITAKTSSLADKSPAHVGNYSYDKTKVHAATKAGNTELSYDKAGYMASRGSLTFTWDHLGRKIETKDGDKTVQKTWYDHTTRRIVKQEGSHHTFTIHPLVELREGAFLHYVVLGQDRIAGTWSVKGVDKFFDDVAGGKADGAITAADAWVYHGTRSQIDGVKTSLKARPIDLDLTRDMLASSAMRLLLGDKEETHYYHVDHLGSVRAVTDSKGEVILRKHYYPYGAVRAMSGATNIYAPGFQNTEYDKASGTNAFLKRSLDTRLGRWLSPDPLFSQIRGPNDEFNSYGLVRNNPVRNRDIQGTDSGDGDEAMLYGGGGMLALTIIFGGLGALAEFFEASGDPSTRRKSTKQEDKSTTKTQTKTSTKKHRSPTTSESVVVIKIESKRDLTPAPVRKQSSTSSIDRFESLTGLDIGGRSKSSRRQSYVDPSVAKFESLTGMDIGYGGRGDRSSSLSGGQDTTEDTSKSSKKKSSKKSKKRGSKKKKKSTGP